MIRCILSLGMSLVACSNGISSVHRYIPYVSQDLKSWCWVEVFDSPLEFPGAPFAWECCSRNMEIAAFCPSLLTVNVCPGRFFQILVFLSKCFIGSTCNLVQDATTGTGIVLSLVLTLNFYKESRHLSFL